MSSDWIIGNEAHDVKRSELQGGGSMAGLIGSFMILLCSLIMVSSGARAQSEMSPQQSEISPQTIKGDLLSIKGDRYVVKDLSGRLVYLRIDKNTKHERMVVPGERIEADVMIGERVVALRPSK
jgi:hypothetical protein